MLRATIETESLKRFLETRGGVLSVAIQAVMHG
jgi:hypothetical protein